MKNIKGIEIKLTMGERFHLIRHLNKMDQKTFAETLGIPLTTYQNWEYDKTTPSNEKAMALAERLYVEPAWLILGIGSITI